MNLKKKIENSIENLEIWIESHNYMGYEPFDGNSSFLHILTFNSLFLERVLQQAVLRFPFNIRSFIGIKPRESTKGRGYMARGYLENYKNTVEDKYKKKAIDCLDWLKKNKSTFFEKYSWGNLFPFSGRGVRLKTMEPTIVWTSLIGQAFLDAYDILQDNKYLEIASNICDWIILLPRESTESGFCLSYVKYKQCSVHNSNMLGAAMLARTAKLIKNKEYLKVAEDAMKYSCSRQNQNGSWFYGEARKFRWIDNFHTGYNLESLKIYLENTHNHQYTKNLESGFKFYRNNFFDEASRPKYYNNKLFPIDIQCV
ncbi:MAG: hypothetical protein ACTSRG_27195 [Candidatus Helarchaeota archaeon]